MTIPTLSLSKFTQLLDDDKSVLGMVSEASTLEISTLPESFEVEILGIFTRTKTLRRRSIYFNEAGVEACIFNDVE